MINIIPQVHTQLALTIICRTERSPTPSTNRHIGAGKPWNSTEPARCRNKKNNVPQGGASRLLPPLCAAGGRPPQVCSQHPPNVCHQLHSRRAPEPRISFSSLCLRQPQLPPSCQQTPLQQTLEALFRSSQIPVHVQLSLKERAAHQIAGKIGNERHGSESKEKRAAISPSLQKGEKSPA